jgi:DNA-binding beta-propeller fold protein YncE
VWTRSYNGPVNRDDSARKVAVSPDGSKVFVTGTSWRSTSDSDYATVAYNAGTGVPVWAKRYNGPANYYDSASAVAVSPNSSKVFVTGIGRSTTGDDYATVAYNAGTGAVVWTKRYNGAAKRDDNPAAVVVSPDASKLFLTGAESNASHNDDYRTLAYSM